MMHTGVLKRGLFLIALLAGAMPAPALASAQRAVPPADSALHCPRPCAGQVSGARDGTRLVWKVPLLNMRF